MAIADKDQKILWSKAMGRCSICRKKLVLSAPGATSLHTLLGEMAHIVGENPTSARFNSPLPAADRDRYPNLILLCREHHKIVDDDETTYPIEVLHQLKADHEMWVETLVPEPDDEEIASFYGQIVNTATRGLKLESWDWLTDHAIRDLLPSEFVEGAQALIVQIHRAVWPGRHPQLESALRNLSEHLEKYLSLFMKRAYLSDEWYRQDKRWKQRMVDDYHDRVADSAAWQRRCTPALMNLVVALNQYADAVRATVQPTYFLHAGRFVVLDSLGVMSNLEGTVYLPSEYQSIPSEEESRR